MSIFERGDMCEGVDIRLCGCETMWIYESVTYTIVGPSGLVGVQV
jgi:hypothetical protein